jgi:hypothetical protein
MTANDFHVHALAGAAYAVTLPDSESIQPGRPYVITKNAGANAITITPFDAADTINGATTLVLAASAFHGAILINTGDVWIVQALY